MANPQKENGYTKIANEIMEHLARCIFTTRQRAVLDVILRDVFGWKDRYYAEISLFRFQRITGLSKPNICHALKELANNNVIIVSKNKCGQKIYAVEKDYDKWKIKKRDTPIVSTDNKM